MPLGAARLTFLAKGATVEAAAAGRTPVSLNVVGNTQIDTSRSVFGGGSALFDGSGDGLNVSADTGSPFYRIEGDWTVECWFNMDEDTGGSTVGLVIVGSHPSSPDYGGGLLIRNFDMKVQTSWDAYNGSDPKQNLSFFGGPTISPDTWNHLAMTYDSTESTWNTFLNGSRINSESVTYSGVKLGDNGRIFIGSGVNSFNAGGNGWIDEVRISNTVRYSGTTYTVPTSALTNDEFTLCLFHMDGTDGSTDFRDDNGKGRARADFFAVGGAEISTTQSKFGGSSAYFNNAEGTYIQASPRSEFAPGTGDFTIEGWFYTTDNSQNGLIFNNRISATGAPNGGNYVRLLNNKLEWQTGSTAYTTTTTPANSTWHHFAVTRENGTMSLYLNGTRENTWTYTGNFSGNRYISLGEFENGTGSATFDGYIDEIRYSSVARYSGTSHTVPTEPFQNDADTIVLLHFNGTDGSTVITDDNGVY